MASATPLLLLYDAKAPNCRKNKAFKGLGHYAEWPKVADAVIMAPQGISGGESGFKSHGFVCVFMRGSSETSVQCGRNRTTEESASCYASDFGRNFRRWYSRSQSIMPSKARPSNTHLLRCRNSLAEP